MSVPALIRRAYKNTTTFPASDTSAPFDLGSGAGRAVLVVCGGDSGTAAGYTFTEVTVTGTGGGSLTAGTEDTSTGRTRRAFWMVDPPSGSQTFTVSTANGSRNFVYTIYLFQDPAVSGASITVTPTVFAISEVSGGANSYTVNSTTVNGLAVAVATCYTNVTSDASSTNATTYTRDTSIYGAAELFAKTGSAGSTALTWQTAGSTTLPYSTFGFALEGSAAGDTTPPTLTSPTGTATGTTTATGTVSTNEGNGTLYRLASTNPTELAATVKAAALTQAVSATGVQNVSFTGLSPSTTYYAHYVHTDAAGNDSARVSSASFTTSAPADTTPPTLSAAAGTGGTLAASASVSTNEGNGTLYAVFTASATAPSAAQVKAGQDNTGAAALRAVSQAVSATGTQTIASGSVSAGTRYVHFMHEDAATNQSAVASSASFVVSSGADTTPPVLSSPVGTQTGSTTATVGATTNEGNGTLYAVVTTSATQPSVAQIKAGQDHTGAALPSGQKPTLAISSTGAKTLGATGLTASTSYYAHLVHTDAAGNDSNRVSSASFTTAAAADTTAPTMSGTVTIGSITSTTATPSWAAGSDNVAVTGYERRINGGSWVDVGNVTSAALTGLSASTAYTVDVRAYDAAGNRSTPISGTFNTSAAPSPEGHVTHAFFNNTLAAEYPAGTQVHFTWFPAGRIGSMAGVTPLDGVGTVNADGALETGVSGAGVVMVAIRRADATKDDVFYEAFSA